MKFGAAIWQAAAARTTNTAQEAEQETAVAAAGPGHPDRGAGLGEAFDGLVADDRPCDDDPVEAPIPGQRVKIVGANRASWDDLVAIFGTTDAGQCQCQRFKVVGWI